jgi:hypothetical protein
MARERVLTAGVHDGEARPVQTSHRSGLSDRVGNCLAAQLLLDLEDGIDALGRDKALVSLLEQQGAVVRIVDHEVNLVRDLTLGIEDEGLRHRVALREKLGQRSAPVELRDLALRSWMLEDLAPGFEAGGERLLLRNQELSEVNAHASKLAADVDVGPTWTRYLSPVRMASTASVHGYSRGFAQPSASSGMTITETKTSNSSADADSSRA